MLTKEQQQAKQELLSIKQNTEGIRRKERELSRLRYQVSGMPDVLSPSQTKVKKAHGSTEYRKAMCRMDGMEKQLCSEITEMTERRNAVISKINTMSAPCGELLYRKYVDNQKFGNIGKYMFYSYRSIMRLHKKALTEFADVS